MNHIDVVEVTNPNGYIVQELTIDGASYGQCRNNLEISILDDFDEERAAFRKYGLKCDEL